MILVAGPYRSGTTDDPVLIARNVRAMTDMALRLFRAGHLPVLGEWYALPLIELAGSKQKGPAEIPPKRIWTYRWCAWWAAQQGIAFRFPAVHPFNPLPYLQLAIAAGNRPQAIRRIFEALWTTNYSGVRSISHHFLAGRMARCAGV
jgi:hypothetical protein